MKRTNRQYQLQYKKKTADCDRYSAGGASLNACVCRGCGAVYRNKRWYAEDRNAENGGRSRTTCPACRKIRDNCPGGIVTLKGVSVVRHRSELMNLIRNEEERARGFNPLERVMSVRENGFGSLIIATTNEKLAQRLGRAIQKAFHGEVAYTWSQENKLVRVAWEQAA